MHNVQSPCATDALYGIKIIMVNGKSVGITRLCDVIAAVQSLHLSGEEEITRALLQKASENNYIPEPMRDAYGKALLYEYRADCRKGLQEQQ